MVPFLYLEPASLDEACALLSAHGDEAKLLAGGTGLVNLMKQRLVQPGVVIGLRALKSLEGVAAEGDLRIGALATLYALETSSLVKQHSPLLAETLRHVATVRVRAMATLGGAMAHGDPHLDTPPALIALDARIRVLSQRGARDIPIDQFFTGYFETVLRPDEMVTEIVIPPQPEGNGWSFVKFLPATHDDYATVSVAARLTLGRDGLIRDARIALGAMGLVPVRATAAETALRGMTPDAASFRQAASLVAEAVDPIANFRGSVEYKRAMAVVHVRRALAQAASRAKAA